MDKKIKNATVNPINKKSNKCFQYAVTSALNHEEIKKDWEGVNYPSEKDYYKKSEKNLTITFNVLYAKKEKIYILLMFQNVIQRMKNKLFFNDSKWRRMALSRGKKTISRMNNVQTR